MPSFQSISEEPIATFGDNFVDGAATLDANFTQTSTGIAVVGGVSTQSANFTHTSAGTRVRLDDALLVNSFTVGDITANIVSSADATLTASFTQTSAGIGIFVDSATMSSTFTMTSAGRYLWEPVNTGDSTETWTEIAA